MSKIDELIAELCPDGVEYKCLGEIAEIVRGNGLQKSDFTENGVGCIHYGQIYTKFDLFADKTITYVSEELAGKLKKVEKGDLVVAITSENYEDICKCVVWLGNETIVTGGHAAIVKHNQDPKYLAYCFCTLDFMKQKVKLAQGTKVMEISPERLARIKLPVPPLEVQREIVHVLDEFTLYQNELAAELAARKKQYEYYRDSLLTFSDDVPKMKLGDIATEMYRGAGIKRDEVTTDGIPCIRYGEIYTDYEISFTECVSHTSESVVANPKFFEYGDIIFTITGENVEEIAKSVVYLGSEQCMAGGDTVVMKHNQEPRFMSYVLSTTSAQAQKSKGKVKSKVVHSSVPALKEIVVPIPDVETQKRIADILDNFHMLINDISEGLPAEIELRRKQYEYYRDKLLTFKEKEA